MRGTVLIVDDEPMVTIALMTRLQSGGYQVIHAINGLAGVEAAALCDPDVVVLDIGMPDIDGFEACTRIRRLPGKAGLPVLFLSGRTDEATVARAAGVGALGVVGKPYDASLVLSMVGRAACGSASGVGQGC